MITVRTKYGTKKYIDNDYCGYEFKIVKNHVYINRFNKHPSYNDLKIQVVGLDIVGIYSLDIIEGVEYDIESP